jgi:cell division protein FtsQ
MTAVGGTRRVPMDPRLRARRVALTRAAGRRRLHRLVAAVTVLAVLTVAVALAFSPLLSVHTITVRGAGLDRAAVQRASGISTGDPMVLVGAGAAAAAIERLPWIHTASVSRDFPTAVTITVTERVAVAWAPSGPGHYSLVDASGQVTTVTTTPPQTLPELAGITGVPSPGRHLAAGTAATAAALSPALRATVTTILVLPTTGITALIANGPQLRFGDASQLPAKAQAAAYVLGALVHPASYIDVSVPAAPVAG